MIWSRLSDFPWGSNPPVPTSSLQTPSSKRISITAGTRLGAIVEGHPDSLSATDIPGQAVTSDYAILPSNSKVRPLSDASGWTTSTKAKSNYPRVSAETLPSDYARHWPVVSQHQELQDSNKEELIRESHQIAKRGGWGRLSVILAVLLCIAIALGVGLGVGLSRHSKPSPSTVDSSSSSSSAAGLGFPIGEYSLNTALRTIQTNCTSNPATWRCYPYATYSGSNSTSSTASLTTFNWILSNTSSAYISNVSLPTTDGSGKASNVSVSSSDNPFSISFSNQPLQYYNNDGRPRFELKYDMTQAIIPTAALTADNSASTCFYNNTILTAVLYLSDVVSIDYPTANTKSLGSYQDWPFAVRVEQTAAGGANVPACYETVNGTIGDRILTGFTEEHSSDECVCDYGNFEQ